MNSLTFSELCPIWNDKINKGKMWGGEINGKMMSIVLPETCVVGEANRWNVITCVECLRHYSVGFVHLATLNPKDTHYKIYKEDIITKFMKHWNEKH